MKRSLLLLLLIPSWLWAQDVPDPDPNRFAEAFTAFAQQDYNDPFGPGGIVFVGSSSVRMLDIPRVLPGIVALNRGFGGAQWSGQDNLGSVDSPFLRSNGRENPPRRCRPPAAASERPPFADGRGAAGDAVVLGHHRREPAHGEAGGHRAGTARGGYRRQRPRLH